MNIQEVLRTTNQMVADRIIEGYAWIDNRSGKTSQLQSEGFLIPLA